MEYGHTQPQSGSTSGSTSDKILNKMRDLPEDAEETLDSARDRLNETLQDVTAKLQEAASYADQQVQAKPWTAVGVGFGVGIVMGALLTLAARR